VSDWNSNGLLAGVGVFVGRLRVRGSVRDAVAPIVLAHALMVSRLAGLFRTAIDGITLLCQYKALCGRERKLH
jgi:hypothetical protein